MCRRRPYHLRNRCPERRPPLTLPLVYRVLTRPLTPLVLLYLQRRRQRGKEDGRRLRERQGFACVARPPAAAVVDPCRQRRRGDGDAGG